MTIGTITRGALTPSATAGNPRQYHWVSWNGVDSLIKITEPHPTRDPYGVFRRSTRWVEKRPEDEGPRAVTAFGLIGEALRLRDQLESPLERKFRELPFNPGWRDDKRLPKRARLTENPYRKDWTIYNSTIHDWVEQVISVNCVDQPVARRTDLMDWLTNNWSSNSFSYWTANDDIKLINRLREKMQGTEFNPAVFLGEGHQALDMIARSARRIAGSLYRLKRGDFLGAAKALAPSAGRDPGFIPSDRLRSLSAHSRLLKRQGDVKSVAGSLGITEDLAGRAIRALDRGKKLPKGVDRESLLRVRREASRRGDLHNTAPKEFSSLWLELQYGWLPLLNDAEEGAAFLAHNLNTPLQTTFRSSRKVEQSGTVSNQWQKCPGFGQRKGRGVQYERKGLIAKVKEKTTVPKLLGLTSLESVAWELTPWSFVIDWFIPIGDWLTARGHAQGLTGTFISTYKRVGEAFEPSGDFNIPVTESYPWKRNYASNGVVVRSISTTLQVPMPTTRPLNKALSWKHCVNAVALLVSGHGGQGYK